MGVVFALLAGASMALWSVFTQKASSGIPHALAAMLISLAAVLAGLILMAIQREGWPKDVDPKLWMWVALTGLMAFLLDYFGLKAYGSGLPLSIGAPIIVASGIALAALIGIAFLGESFTLVKAMGLVRAIAGVALLSR